MIRDVRERIALAAEGLRYPPLDAAEAARASGTPESAYRLAVLVGAADRGEDVGVSVPDRMPSDLIAMGIAELRVVLTRLRATGADGDSAAVAAECRLAYEALADALVAYPGLPGWHRCLNMLDHTGSLLDEAEHWYDPVIRISRDGRVVGSGRVSMDGQVYDCPAVIGEAAYDAIELALSLGLTAGRARGYDWEIKERNNQ